MKHVIFNSKKFQLKKIRSTGKFTAFVSCSHFVFVAGLIEVFFVCFVCFRSRSHPVPHRGERVKQRTMQARNCYIEYKTFRYLPFVCGFNS
jgi:hypothetical protein